MDLPLADNAKVRQTLKGEGVDALLGEVDLLAGAIAAAVAIKKAEITSQGYE